MHDEILVDVDEVLADFQTPALRVIEEVTGRRYAPSDFKQWDIFSVLSKEELEAVFETLRKPGVAASLTPTPGSQEFIQELSELGTVVIVTSPFRSPTWVSERIQWLWDHFRIPHKRVVNTGAKHLVYGRALLDDNPDHVANWLARHPGELGMLWHIPNTRDLEHPNRMHTWAEVIDQVGRHLCR